MTISALVIACLPEDLPALSAALNALAWAEVHYTDEAGRLVISVEATDPDESMRHVQEIERMPGVLEAALAAVCLESPLDPDPPAATGMPTSTVEGAWNRPDGTS